MNYAYMVRCKDGSLYAGWTTDVERRVKCHNAGKGAKYTKSRLPVELVYYETFETKEEAMKREIREETGITDIKIERVAYVTLVNAENPYLIIAYLCEVLTEDVKLSEEHQAYVWADEQTCRNMLPKHIIEDFEKYGIFTILQ